MAKQILILAKNTLPMAKGPPLSQRQRSREAQKRCREADILK